MTFCSYPFTLATRALFIQNSFERDLVKTFLETQACCIDSTTAVCALAHSFQGAQWVYAARFSSYRSHGVFLQLYHVCLASLSSTLYPKFPRSVFARQNWRSIDLWTSSNLLLQNWDHICLFIPSASFKWWIVHCHSQFFYSLREIRYGPADSWLPILLICPKSSPTTFEPLLLFLTREAHAMGISPRSSFVVT